MFDESSVKKVFRGQVTAALDLALSWPIFYLSVLRSAFTKETTSITHLPPLIQSLVNGNPFLKTTASHLSKAPVATVLQLYEGAVSYYITNYMWVIGMEFAVHDRAKKYDLSDTQATICTAVAGSLVGTPGDTLLVRHQNLTRAYQARYNLFREARGYYPTMMRELFFTYIALSGIQTPIAKHLSETFNAGQQSLLLDIAASAITSPIMLFGQPFNRLARVMQQEQLGLIKANRYLYDSGKRSIKNLPSDSSLLKRVATFIEVAYFTGGAYRTFAMLMTATIYGMMRRHYDRLDEQEKTKFSTRSALLV